MSQPPPAVDDFLELVGTGRIDEVRRTLRNDPQLVNAVGLHPFWSGRPQALHVAVEARRRDMFDLLLDAGADVNGVNDQYDLWSPWMLARASACSKRSSSRTTQPWTRWRRTPQRWLLSLGANVNARSNARTRHTALHSAAWNGDLDMARLLAAAGADNAARDDQFDGTPEDWAAKSVSVTNIRRRANRNTSFIMRAVSLPVFVFWRLGW